jgi:hypothetical protein
MEQQLVVMGIRSNPKLDPSSNVVRVLIDMYVDIGDHIALQYGGSEAHKKVTTERSESIVGPIGKVSVFGQSKKAIVLSLIKIAKPLVVLWRSTKNY